MNKIISIFLCISLLYACKSDTQKQDVAADSISGLNTVDKQSSFLLDIFSKDQNVRKNEKLVIQQFGMDSPEHRTAIDEVIETDEKNLQQIESYLKKYGHPNRKVHGREATDTPWLVIHHAASGTGVRRKYFPTFYKAFKDGHMYGDALTMYLNRMYNLKFNKRIEWNRPYSESEEIDTLIQSLKLGPLIQ